MRRTIIIVGVLFVWPLGYVIHHGLTHENPARHKTNIEKCSTKDTNWLGYCENERTHK